MKTKTKVYIGLGIAAGAGLLWAWSAEPAPIPDDGLHHGGGAEFDACVNRLTSLTAADKQRFVQAYGEDWQRRHGTPNGRQFPARTMDELQNWIYVNVVDINQTREEFCGIVNRFFSALPAR